MVNRSWSNLTVTCKKGDKAGIVSVKSKSKATNAGNLLFGGIGGLALDAHTGAGYDYPVNSCPFKIIASHIDQY